MTSFLAPSTAESISSPKGLTERKLIYSNENTPKVDSVPAMRTTFMNYKNLVLLIVAVALLLDGMLNMVILPLVPEFTKYFKASSKIDQFMNFLNIQNGTNKTMIDESKWVYS